MSPKVDFIQRGKNENRIHSLEINTIRVFIVCTPPPSFYWGVDISPKRARLGVGKIALRLGGGTQSWGVRLRLGGYDITQQKINFLNHQFHQSFENVYLKFENNIFSI